jgi:hypothetical protein
VFQQLNLHRDLSGAREWFRRMAGEARTLAWAIGKALGLKKIEADTGYRQSTLSQGFNGEGGRDIPLGLLPYLAQHDGPGFPFGNAIAKFWGCKLVPLPRPSMREQLMEEALRSFGEKGVEVLQDIDREVSRP